MIKKRAQSTDRASLSSCCSRPSSSSFYRGAPTITLAAWWENAGLFNRMQHRVPICCTYTSRYKNNQKKNNGDRCAIRSKRVKSSRVELFFFVLRAAVFLIIMILDYDVSYKYNNKRSLTRVAFLCVPQFGAYVCARKLFSSSAIKCRIGTNSMTFFPRSLAYYVLDR